MVDAERGVMVVLIVNSGMAKGGMVMLLMLFGMDRRRM